MYFKNAHGENANGVYVSGGSGGAPIWVYNNIIPRPTGISMQAHSSNLKKFLSPEIYAYLVDYEP